METARDDFPQIMENLRVGDQLAAGAVFERFVDRLTALASRQFTHSNRHRADPEGVVQSVYRSFFERVRRDEFPSIDNWGRLWALLVTITLRKCSKKRKQWWGRKAVAADERWLEAVDRAPTPLQAAVLTDLVERISAEIPRSDHAMLEGIFQGCTAVDIAARCGCSERTVRRLRKVVYEIAVRLDSENEPAAPAAG